jgi:hypothetical protein
MEILLHAGVSPCCQAYYQSTGIFLAVCFIHVNMPRIYLWCGSIWRMLSSGMLYHVAFVGTDISEERSTSVIRVAKIVFLQSVHRLLVMANAVLGSLILLTLMMEALCVSETSVPTRATQRPISEDLILHSHCHENLTSYMEAFALRYLARRCRKFILLTLLGVLQWYVTMNLTYTVS